MQEGGPLTNAEIAAGFEALCIRAAAWAGQGPEYHLVSEAELHDFKNGPLRKKRFLTEVATLSRVARLMAWIFGQMALADEAKRARWSLEKPPTFEDWFSGKLAQCTDQAPPLTEREAAVLGRPSQQLYEALAVYRKGEDRGELMALLEEASEPPRGLKHGASDLRGLAARESQTPGISCCVLPKCPDCNGDMCPNCGPDFVGAWCSTCKNRGHVEMAANG